MEIALKLLNRLREEDEKKCKQLMDDLPPSLLKDPEFCWNEKKSIKSYYTLMKHKRADLWYIQIDGPEDENCERTTNIFPIFFRDGEAFLDESNDDHLEKID